MDTSLLEKIAEQRKVSTFRQHLMLCTSGKCAPESETNESWEYLKRRIRELGLLDVDSGVYRSKVECLRICRQGPIMLSYPDGTWYHSCTPEIIEKILQEHVLNGIPVDDYRFATTGL